MKLHMKLMALAALTAIAAGCASTPKNIPALEQARQDVRTAQADANAQRYAAKEIEESARLLTAAETAFKESKDVAEITHRAYLSTQTAKVAIELGKTKSAEERIAQSSAERERIRLEARTREAEAATAAAQSAQAQAQAAGSQLAIEQQRRAQLEEEMEALNIAAQRSDRGIVVTLGDVLFDTGKAELKSGAGRQLDMLGKFLQEHPERQVLIEGFTDSVGSDEYNQELSRRRAEAVRSALRSRGVDESRIDVQGYGEQFPVGTNADAGGRQLNRRVEVILSNGSEPVPPRARL